LTDTNYFTGKHIFSRLEFSSKKEFDFSTEIPAFCDPTPIFGHFSKSFENFEKSRIFINSSILNPRSLSRHDWNSFFRHFTNYKKVLSNVIELTSQKYIKDYWNEVILTINMIFKIFSIISQNLGSLPQESRKEVLG